MSTSTDTNSPTDPDLAIVVESWPSLSSNVKAAVVTLVEAATRLPGTN